MAVAAVMVANLYNGLNTKVWTGWVLFAVLIGIVLVWGYTASIMPIRSHNTLLNSQTGNLHHDRARLVLHARLRQLQVPIRVAVLLVRSPPHHPTLPSSSLHLPSRQVRVLPRRLRHRAVHAEGRP